MHSPVSVQVGPASGNSPWLPVDYTQRPFSVGLDVSADAAAVTATFAYTVQWTPDNPNRLTRPASLTRSGTVATLKTVNPHGLSVGDSVVSVATGDANLEGAHDVASVVDPNTLTYTVANSGATLAGPDPKVILLRVFPDGNMTAKTARAYENSTTPMRAVRLNATLTAGIMTLTVVQGYGRG